MRFIQSKTHQNIIKIFPELKAKERQCLHCLYDLGSEFVKKGGKLQNQDSMDCYEIW